MAVSGGATPFMTNSNNPNGGVVKLISSARSIIKPNHTVSNPNDCARGKKIGSVKSIMDICSMNMPSNKSTPNITSSMAMGSRSNPVAQLISPCEAPARS